MQFKIYKVILVEIRIRNQNCEPVLIIKTGTSSEAGHQVPAWTQPRLLPYPLSSGFRL